MQEKGEFGPRTYYSPDATGGGAESFAASGSEEELTKYLESLQRGAGNERYESGNAIESTLRRHPRKETVLNTVRRLAFANEREVTGGEMPNDYAVGRQADILKDRRIALSIPFEELKNEGLAQPLDHDSDIYVTLKGDLEKNGGGVLKSVPGADIRYFGLAVVGGYGLQEIPVRVQRIDSYEIQGGKKKNARFRDSNEMVVYFGGEDERTGFSDWLEDMEAEVLVRHLIQRNWGRYNYNRENLAGLVEMYYGPVPTASGIKELFNLREIEGVTKETVVRGEVKTFGDKIDMAMRLYYINGLCQKTKEFAKLMETPFWKEVVFPNATQEELEIWVGKPKAWREEDEPGEKRTKDDLKEEASDGRRGLLTKINVFAESSDETQKLHENIRVFLGGAGNEGDRRKRGVAKKQADAAEAAQQIAYKIVKLWMMADELGYEIYYDPKQKASLGHFEKRKLEFENGPAGSDFGKLVYPFLYSLKNYRKGRDFGPITSFGDYDTMAASVLSVLSTKLDELPDENGYVAGKKEERRSFLELWRGHPEGDGRPKESSMRLGEMPWIEQGEEVLVVPYLSAYMAGRKQKGTYPIVLATASGETWDKNRLMDENWWRALWKAIDVGIKPGIPLRGVFRDKDSEELSKLTKEHKSQIVQSFWKGLSSTVEYKIWYDSEYVEMGALGQKKTTVVEKIRATAKKVGFDLPNLQAITDLKTDQVVSKS